MKIQINPSLVATDFFDMLRNKMKLYGYRPHTIKAYLGQINSFLRFNRLSDFNKINKPGIRDYFDFLLEKGLSRSTIDQAIKAIEILYYETHREPLDLCGFKKPQKDRPTPVVLTYDEVNKITVSTKSIIHRLMIELAYSAGLRVSELVEVRVKDLNFEKLTLFVPGLGRKNRTTVFSECLKDKLIAQAGSKNGAQFLFPSKRGGILTTRAVAKFFKKALIISGLKKMATPHSLRQSFANTMLDQGTDPTTLQSILGRRTLSNLSSDSKKAA